MSSSSTILPVYDSGIADDLGIADDVPLRPLGEEIDDTVRLCGECFRKIDPNARICPHCKKPIPRL